MKRLLLLAALALPLTAQSTAPSVTFTGGGMTFTAFDLPGSNNPDLFFMNGSTFSICIVDRESRVRTVAVTITYLPSGAAQQVYVTNPSVPFLFRSNERVCFSTVTPAHTAEIQAVSASVNPQNLEKSAQ